MDESTAGSILIVQTAFLGDLLLGIPFIRHLKSLFPRSKISLVCREGVGSVLKDLKIVDQIFEIKKNQGDSYKSLLLEFSNTEFDYVFSPHESLRSAFFVRKLKAKNKISFKSWWNATFFDLRVSKIKKNPEALRQLSLAGPFDKNLSAQLKNFSEKYHFQKGNHRKLDAVPEWANGECLEEIINSNINVKGKYACLFPGSVWNTKRWTENGFIEVAAWLQKNSYQVVLMGGADEKALCESIQQKIPEALIFAGKTNLMESLSLLKSASLCVSNDSAGQHLASIAGTPTVSIFGPTVLEQGFRPWNSNSVIVELRGLECRPCGKHGHKVCPIKTHQCMKGIHSSEVILAIESVLSPPTEQTLSR